MWEPPSRQSLEGERLHFQHGPIDIVLKAWGAEAEVAAAYHAAWQRFPAILPELADELAELRLPMSAKPFVTSPVALRMLSACGAYPDCFVTPMAAVAGAVADELLAVMLRAAKLDRAFVNDGGDIAVHLADGQRIDLGVIGDFSRGSEPAGCALLSLQSGSPVRGIATSGVRGRSFSLGIADSVTALARTAAQADVAATLIANGVNLQHRGIVRVPASDLDPDSDLGDRLVTRAVPALTKAQIETALGRGLDLARRFRQRGLIVDAALTLQGTTALLDQAKHQHELERVL
jgi:ApbE superfamily uncharacterized protein (UPF0280 family)